MLFNFINRHNSYQSFTEVINCVSYFFCVVFMVVPNGHMGRRLLQKYSHRAQNKDVALPREVAKISAPYEVG